MQVSRTKSALDALALAVCSCGGLGLLPRGPATAGALLGAAVFHLVNPGLAGGALMILAAVLVGVPLTRRVMERTGDKDPQLVILDEVAGVWTAMLGFSSSWGFALAAAVVFRIFDKKKFGPARTLDRRGDAFGVMTDDIVAGIYANLVLRLGVFVHGTLWP